MLLCALLANTASAQNPRFKVISGAGYYLDVLGMVGGEIIWIEGGIKTGNDFYLNLRLSMADIKWTMSDGVFEGYETMAMRQMVDLTFSRPVKLAARHFLEPAVGFKLKKEYSFYPNIEIYQNSIATLYTTKFYEIGFTLCLDYHYDFKSGAYIGMRCDSNIIYACGFEGLTIGPLIGFKF